MRVSFRKVSRRARLILNISFPLVVANFAVYWFVAVYLGGDALHGMAKAGHYFVCSHGECTEVTPSVWHYSYWHAITALAGIVLVFLEMAILINTGDIEVDPGNRS
jgi:hypothetical protein